MNQLIKTIVRRNLIKSGNKCNILSYPISSRYFSEDIPTSTDSLSQPPDNVNLNKESRLGGFAKAYEKHSLFDSETSTENVPDNNQTFASLLRNSSFIDLGDPEGKIVSGKIFHIVENDLYIDFGWKFHCVCTRPHKNAEDYVRGTIVRLRIKDLELSTRFLGSSKDLTILEADCQLLGILQTPTRGDTKRQRPLM